MDQQALEVCVEQSLVSVKDTVLTHKDGGEAEGVLAETVHLHLAHLYQLQWDIIGQGDSFLPHCTTDLSIAVGAEGVFKPNSHGKAFVPD